VSQESFAFVRDEKNSPLTLKVKGLVDAWRTMMPVLTGTLSNTIPIFSSSLPQHFASIHWHESLYVFYIVADLLFCVRFLLLDF
jgi:hypothetical protein